MTGLLTFTEADNYGALLQAYALQKVLQTLGHESEFLNIKPPVAPPEKDLSNLPPVLRKRIEETIAHYKLRAARFEEFRKKNLRISAPIRSEDIVTLDSRYDRFIVGSDQVWNAGVTGGDLLYALPFASPAKRYSYAASFGGTEGLEKASDSFGEELKQFRMISLREADGVGLCRDKIGVMPLVHIDPSMLLTRREWQALLPEEKKVDEPYVLLFLIEYDADFYARAKAFAESKGLPLKIVTASYIPQFGFEAYSGTGVEDWLMKIRDASYVFCDSFHGSVFSVIFEKNFCANLSKAKLVGRSSRLVLLLEGLGLDTDNMNENVDYEPIRAKICREREKSFAYLKEVYE